MAYSVKVSTRDVGVLPSLRAFLRSVLASETIGALLVPAKVPGSSAVMPTLVADPEQLQCAQPLTPAFPMNAARLVSRLTRKSAGKKIAAFLRPCEIRAFVELVKLHQGIRENAFLIGFDCLGAFSSQRLRQMGNDAPDGISFYRALLADPSGSQSPFAPATACQMCEHPVAKECDLSIVSIGADLDDHFFVTAETEAGEAVFRELNLDETELPPGRAAAVAEMIQSRVAHRDEVFARTRDEIDGIEKLGTYFSNCINCYNCRVACPVCYCRECVFGTDVFDHEPLQYLKWAERKGSVKLPTDTIFYHMTRLAHMSAACVGCGQCTNACPNEIPLVEVFRTVAHQTQAAFDYEAGRSLVEAPPLTIFKEDEFEDIIGIGVST